MKVSPARAAAFRILFAVETEQRHADDLLHGEALEELTPRDRGLATTLVMSTLRWQLALDAAIAPLLRSNTELPSAVAIALRMGLLQLWFLDRIPAHAALSESVEMVKANGAAGMTGLVNAVLRKLSRQSTPEISRAAALAHPAWMLDRWRHIYGEARAQRMCEADQQVPPATIRRKPNRLLPEGAEPGALLTAACRGVAGEHELRVQDEGSQLVAEIAAIAAPDAAHVLDACAAPGGKTAALAERLPQARIVASDISAARLKTMRRLLPPEYLPRTATVKADAMQLPESPPFEEPFGLVLCDCPCSGTGTLARNPEIRLRLRQSDLQRFAQQQLRILLSCWQKVAAGGVMVYSTCSLEPEENARVVQQFVAAEKNAKVVPVGRLLEDLKHAERLTESGAALLLSSAVTGESLQTLPGVHPCDGFFVAVFRKQL